MSAYAFGAFIAPESDMPAAAVALPTVVHRDEVTSRPPTAYELDELQWGQRLTGPKSTPVRPSPAYGPSLPETPHELETSQPSTPTPGELEQSRPSTRPTDRAVDAVVQSFSNPPRHRWRVLAACLMYLLLGMNDAATGALIPYLEAQYRIGYAVVSLIFVANALGFISMAPLTQIIDARAGRSISSIIAASLMSVAYVSMICAPPFPVVVVSFYLIGCGMALFLALTNAFVVNLLNGTVLLGFCHGLYGVGGVVSPIMATAMVSAGFHWSYFYTITLGVALTSVLCMGWAFRGFANDAAVQLLTSLERTASRQATALGEPTKPQLLLRALRNRTTLLGALFIFFYQGAEVAISGWVISYLIHYRQGDPSQVGNVTAGFWGGITLGRFVLTPFAHKIGEKLAVLLLIAGAAVFQLLVWLVPNIIGNALAESIVGLFLGPVYPCATAVFSKLLPRSVQISSLSVVTSMGSSGGAVVPFITGLLAQKLGTVVLHPIVLISLASMTASWLFLPPIAKRME